MPWGLGAATAEEAEQALLTLLTEVLHSADPLAVGFVLLCGAFVWPTSC